MIPDWIVWTVVFVGLLTLAAAALLAVTIALVLLNAYREGTPAKVLHKLGKRLLASPDREQARVGFDLIGAAHTLDRDRATCGCPKPEPIDGAS